LGRLFGRERGHVLERVHVALGQHEEVRFRERMEVPYRDEAVGLVDMVALGDEGAEETAAHLTMIARRGRMPGDVRQVRRERGDRSRYRGDRGRSLATPSAAPRHGCSF